MRNRPNNRWPVLGKLSQQEFLQRYWQKRPVLLKRALYPFPDVITPEEVAGMSCDERVESRLIMEKGGKRPWELKRGPFKPAMFKKLPKTHWTILVNGVDQGPVPSYTFDNVQKNGSIRAIFKVTKPKPPASCLSTTSATARSESPATSILR